MILEVAILNEGRRATRLRPGAASAPHVSPIARRCRRLPAVIRRCGATPDRTVPADGDPRDHAVHRGRRWGRRSARRIAGV